MQVMVTLLLWPLAAVVRGFVLQVLWGWFMVTTFALAALTIPQALGLSMTVSFLTYQISNRKPNTDTDHTAVEMTVTGIMWSGMALAMGWIIHLFM